MLGLPRPLSLEARTTRRKPMYEGVDLTGLRNIQSSAMTWDFIKRLRDTTKMKIVLKGILAWEDAKLAADDGHRRASSSPTTAAAREDSGRSTIEALPEIIEAVKGRMPVLVDSGFRRGTDIVKALCMGATARRRRPALSVGPRRLRPARRRARARVLRTELDGVMQQVGAPSLKDLKPRWWCTFIFCLSDGSLAPGRADAGRAQRPRPPARERCCGNGAAFAA